jgi:hypothetical protein
MDLSRGARTCGAPVIDRAARSLRPAERMRCTAIPVVAVVVLAAGCTGRVDADMAAPDAASPPAPDARTMDAVDRLMIDEAANVGAFTRINRAPYASTVGSFDINVYLSQDARDYRRIHPETTGSGVVLPPGTLIVRQVLDAQGQVTKVTLMAKQAASYDPTLGDWWFGVTDPTGVPLQDSSGPQVGRLTECHGCHLPRAQDDYLFGVPQGS